MTLILSSLYFQETYKSGATQSKPITLSRIPTQSLQPIASYYATRNQDTLELSGVAQNSQGNNRVGLKPLNILIQNQDSSSVNNSAGGLRPIGELQGKSSSISLGGLRPLSELKNMSSPNNVQDKTVVTANQNTRIKAPVIKQSDNVELSGIASTKSTTVIRASSVNQTSKVDVIKFVDKSDAENKIDLAKEKIKNWNLKITSLDALIKYQSMNGEAFIDGGKQLTKARGDALDARIDATKSVNEAVRAINSLALTTGFVSAEHDSLIDNFRKMEISYDQTEKKNTDILANVKNYLTSSLTSSLVQIGKAFDIVTTTK